MPVMQLTTGAGSVPALTANASLNVCSGQQYEFMPYHANIKIAIVTRGAANSVLATVYSGTDLLQQEAPVPVLASGIFPKFPDDYNLKDDVMAGDRLNITLRNTTGATVETVTIVQIEPLG